MPRFPLLVLPCVLLVALGLLGCGPANNTPVKPGNNKTEEHAHDHATVGPHGGHLVELAEPGKEIKEEYHVEWDHEENGIITVWILDGAAKKTVPIAADSIFTADGLGAGTYRLRDALSGAIEANGAILHGTGGFETFLQGLQIQVRGLGVLNIRVLFGDNAVKPAKSLDIIMQLEMLQEIAPQMQDRLKIKAQSESILGVKIPKAIIPVAAGRNIAVLVEVAVRNHILRLRGVDSTRQFMQRHSRELRRNADKALEDDE